MMHLVPVETVEAHGVTHAAPAAGALAPARRLRAHRCRARISTGALDQANYCIKCHNQGKDSCSHGPEGKDRRFQEQRLRRHAGRLPARREDLRDERGEAARQPHRRAGHRHHRQSDGGRHRASHLQRLHEVLHLPEAGAGRHPAGRDAHAQGRAGAALGLRDLQPADALEPAELRAPAAARADAATRCWWSGSGRRASRWRII